MKAWLLSRFDESVGCKAWWSTGGRFGLDDTENLLASRLVKVLVNEIPFVVLGRLEQDGLPAVLLLVATDRILPERLERRQATVKRKLLALFKLLKDMKAEARLVDGGYWHGKLLRVRLKRTEGCETLKDETINCVALLLTAGSDSKSWLTNDLQTLRLEDPMSIISVSSFGEELNSYLPSTLGTGVLFVTLSRPSHTGHAHAIQWSLRRSKRL